MANVGDEGQKKNGRKKMGEAFYFQRSLSGNGFVILNIVDGWRGHDAMTGV